jgi:hypothetical protein
MACHNRLRFKARYWIRISQRKMLFKKVCKAQKFTILGLRNLKSIYYELYTTVSEILDQIAEGQNGYQLILKYSLEAI